MSSALERLKALAAAKKEKENAPASVPQAPAQLQPEVPAEPVQETNSEPETQVLEVPEPAVESAEVSSGTEVQTVAVQTEPHPLLMELAELEQQLEAKVPDFRLTLRNIHQKLRQDPALVTILSEEEIGLIVTGLATHANAEIVAPKAAKAARATAKKTPISADDL